MPAYDWHEYLVTRILCRRAERQLFGREQTDEARYHTLVEARAASGDDRSPPIRHPRELLKTTNAADSWRYDVLDSAKGSYRAVDDSIVFEVEATTETDWHIQVLQVGLDLKEGQKYVVKFQAKASAARKITITAGIDQEDWHDIGLHEPIALTSEFQSFELTLRPHDVVKNKNRIGFILGGETGTVFIKDMSLVESE
jgi:hypothetical protein